MFSILTPDVCIVGGGPAGAALACTLSQSGYFDSNETGKRIMMLDSSPKLPQLETYKQSDPNRVPEPRVVTLSPSSIRLLRSIGILDASSGCDQRFITSFQDMLVYEQAGSAYMRFNSKLQRESWLVQMQEHLQSLVLSKDKIDQFEEAKV